MDESFWEVLPECMTWDNPFEGTYICSNCGYVSGTEFDECPECGRKEME